jgi:hypothetical protein
MDALRWRLHGPVGPRCIAERLAKEEEESPSGRVARGAAFMIAEVALTVSRADWTRTKRILGEADVAAEVELVLSNLRELACKHLEGVDGSSPLAALRAYVETAFSEVSRSGAAAASEPTR